MAVRWDNSGERLTASATNYSALTQMGWFRMNTDRGVGTMAFCLQYFQNSGSTGMFTWINGSSLTLQLSTADGSGGATGSTIAVGEWFHLTQVLDASNITAFLNGTQDCQTTKATPTYDRYAVGGNTDWFNGKCTGYKAWTTNLTAAAIQSEMRRLRPVRYTNLLTFCPFFVDLLDRSGNGLSWTASGVSYEDGPPVGWGSPPLRCEPAGPYQYARPISDVSRGSWTAHHTI